MSEATCSTTLKESQYPTPNSLPKLDAEEIQDHIKIVVLGNRGIGKTYFILTAANKALPLPGENYVTKAHPLTFGLNCHKTCCMVWDTNDSIRKVYGNGEECDKFGQKRKKWYENVSLILLCYAVDDVSSFEALADFWMKEVQEMAPGKPIFLVGLRADLRSVFFGPALTTHKVSEFVSRLSVEELKEQHEFERCFECSIYFPHMMNDIFVEAIKVINSNRKSRDTDAEIADNADVSMSSV